MVILANLFLSLYHRRRIASDRMILGANGPAADLAEMDIDLPLGMVDAAVIAMAERLRLTQTPSDRTGHGSFSRRPVRRTLAVEGEA
jgi:hypothetical protein